MFCVWVSFGWWISKGYVAKKPTGFGLTRRCKIPAPACALRMLQQYIVAFECLEGSVREAPNIPNMTSMKLSKIFKNCLVFGLFPYPFLPCSVSEVSSLEEKHLVFVDLFV